MPEGNPSPELLNSLSSLSNSTLSLKGRRRVKNSRFTRKKAAFTLAEVLITLGIIGIVAAMTMPALMTKTRDRELVSRTKKTFSNIQNAILAAQNSYGTIGDNKALFDYDKGYTGVTQEFAKFFNGAKVCKNSKDKGCAPYYYKLKYSTMRASDTSGTAGALNISTAKIILNDGAVLAVVELTPNCDQTRLETQYNSDGSIKTDEDGNPVKANHHVSYCAIVRFDVNGPKLPNQFGADAYGIIVYPDKMKADTWTAGGGESLKSILTGKGELTYKNYTAGEKYDF